MAGILLLWFVDLDIFKLFFHIISCSCCWCSLPPTTIEGWVTLGYNIASTFPIPRFFRLWFQQYTWLVISVRAFKLHDSRESEESMREAVCVCVWCWGCRMWADSFLHWKCYFWFLLLWKFFSCFLMMAWTISQTESSCFSYILTAVSNKWKSFPVFRKSVHWVHAE